MNGDDIYKQAIAKFGIAKQTDMLIEEMAELTQSLLKNRRKPNDGAVLENVYEEFADVTIVMRRIQTLLFPEQLAGHVAYKLVKLKQLIDKD